MTYRICFVCLGNICRSPMAEAVCRSKLAERGLDRAVEVASAGTGGWHVGQDADPRALDALAGRGYLLRHRARQFVHEWFADYDLVVALDRSNLAALERLAPDDGSRSRLVLLRQFDPAAVESGDLDVPDPYYGGSAGFEPVLDLIERACEGLLDHVRDRVAA